jgi:hypothetical protein
LIELPRQPVSRKNRRAHLPNVASSTEETTADVSVGEIAALKANMARLGAEVDASKGLVIKLCAELGVSG